VVVAGIIILQINHLSINVLEEFIKKKVNELFAFLSSHGWNRFAPIDYHGLTPTQPPRGNMSVCKQSRDGVRSMVDYVQRREVPLLA